MPVINYLTTCIFDSGALKQLAGTAKKLGMIRPFIVTDPGIKAAGILAKVEDALGVAPAGVFAETVPNPTEKQTKEAAAAYKACGADGLIAFTVDRTSVRARLGEAKLALDALQQLRRDGVFQLVGDRLRALDGHLEDVDEHAFGQPVPANDVA